MERQQNLDLSHEIIKENNSQDKIKLLKDDLKFVKEPPQEIKIECPICLHVMEEPNLTSCCGLHFCGACIKKVLSEGGSCPSCKSDTCHTFLNKDRQRIIQGLNVYCTNTDCNWSGDLNNLLQHLNRGSREGECEYEIVKCRSDGCTYEARRIDLESHERDECLERTYTCEYCNKYSNTFNDVTTSHYNYCEMYPIICPNGCTIQRQLTRGTIQGHVRVCPLEIVACEFEWTGCEERFPRKEAKEHCRDMLVEHMSLLAVACSKLKDENEKLKRRCDALEKRSKSSYLLSRGVSQQPSGNLSLQIPTL